MTVSRDVLFVFRLSSTSFGACRWCSVLAAEHIDMQGRSVQKYRAAGVLTGMPVAIFAKWEAQIQRVLADTGRQSLEVWSLLTLQQASQCSFTVQLCNLSTQDA